MAVQVACQTCEVNRVATAISSLGLRGGVQERWLTGEVMVKQFTLTDVKFQPAVKYKRSFAFQTSSPLEAANATKDRTIR